MDLEDHFAVPQLKFCSFYENGSFDLSGSSRTGSAQRLVAAVPQTNAVSGRSGSLHARRVCGIRSPPVVSLGGGRNEAGVRIQPVVGDLDACAGGSGGGDHHGADGGRHCDALQSARSGDEGGSSEHGARFDCRGFGTRPLREEKVLRSTRSRKLKKHRSAGRGLVEGSCNTNAALATAQNDAFLFSPGFRFKSSSNSVQTQGVQCFWAVLCWAERPENRCF